MPVCVYVNHMCEVPVEARKNVLDPLEHELQIVGTTMWVLGTKP